LDFLALSYTNRHFAAEVHPNHTSRGSLLHSYREHFEDHKDMGAKE